METSDFSWLNILAGATVLSWILFQGLDRLYRRVRREVYYLSDSSHEEIPSMTFLQGVISIFRSSILNILIPFLAFSILIVWVLPLVWITGRLETVEEQLLSIAGFSFMLFTGIGWLIQKGYERSILGLMMEKSELKDSPKEASKKMQKQSLPVQIKVLNGDNGISLSKRGTEKRSAAKGRQRIAWIRDTGAPLSAMLGALGIAYALEMKWIEDEQLILYFLMGWGLFFLLVGITSSIRLVDRSPFRQFRLGFGLWLHALLLLPAALTLLILELSGNGGIPSRQWQIISEIGHWLNRQLRSSRIYWIPVVLLTSIIPSLPEFKGVNAIPWKPLVMIVGSILLFEGVYRLFNVILTRGQQNWNHLVFLRVFGDPRRGRFLFRHLVPRWFGMGNITCIAAHDVSVHQLDPDIGFDFLLGRLRQRFLTRDEAP